MPRAWASALVVAVLWGCGGGTGAWQPVEGTVEGGGLEITLITAYVDDHSVPWRGPKPGTHCIVYELRVRSTDGAQHDLRADEFRASNAIPLDAVGQCWSPQLEPTWVGAASRTVDVTILEQSAIAAPLEWRPS